MESYLFKLENDRIGIFQKNGGDVHIYIDMQLFSSVQNFSILASLGFIAGWDELPIEKLIQQFVTQALFEKGFSDVGIKETSDKKIAGLFNVRINRGGLSLYKHHLSNEQFIDDLRNYEMIYNLLLETFNFIEPDESNITCFGNKLRHIILLACTEVEHLLRSFLIENGLKSKRTTMSDYFEVNSYLKIDKYSVDTPLYPKLPKITPFERWDSKKPSASLLWYDAYNSVKHNRSGDKHKATLDNAISSVAAIHVLLVAQYGREIFDVENNTSFKSMFRTLSQPTFTINEIECPQISEPLNFGWNRSQMLSEEITLDTPESSCEKSINGQ